MVFLWASVPHRAAEMESAGDADDRVNGGGLKRFRDDKRPLLRLRVGERPAAAGAEAGVIDEGLTKVSRRGVDVDACVMVGRLGAEDTLVKP